MTPDYRLSVPTPAKTRPITRRKALSLLLRNLA